METTSQFAADEPQTPDSPVSLSAVQRMAILKAISDPRRMEILEKLSGCEGNLGCSGLRDCMPISAATLSHHVKELETAGLVRDITRQQEIKQAWQAFLLSLQQL